MKKNQRLHFVIYSIISAIIRLFVPVKPKHWVFGAFHGESYREGSKYLMEYMLVRHPEFKCTFITNNKNVYNELREKKIPCEMNFSTKGVLRITEADCVFYTQALSDIHLVSKRAGRKLFYLIHGQPFKVAMKMLHTNSPKYLESLTSNVLLSKIHAFVYKHLNNGYNNGDICFVSATSEFEASLLRTEYDETVQIKILGMPRNDVLFQPDKMAQAKWVEGLDGKYVITYMPTHRKYGQGNVSPVPFKERQDVQQWMRENNIVLLIKQHPNMVKQLGHVYESDVIRDISAMELDPQSVIYHTDTLITDYSSVWIDFLLLRRPLIFYFYDNFEEEDAGCYYNLRDEFPKNCCESEEALFNMLRKSIEAKDILTPSQSEVSKFHKYIDSNSCKRYFEEINKIQYGQEEA